MNAPLVTTTAAFTLIARTRLGPTIVVVIADIPEMDSTAQVKN